MRIDNAYLQSQIKHDAVYKMQMLVIKQGKVEIENVPVPVPGPNELLVKNIASAISTGTERLNVQQSGKSTIGRLRENPSLLKQAFGVLFSKGLRKTIETYDIVMKGTSEIGYSSCGEVISVGTSVTDIQAGDLVACGGSGKAYHADFVAVPRNLVARVPKGVSPKDACFATVGAIAIHGIRKTECVFGENIAIIGLGLIGQLALRIAQASGMNVFVYDPDTDRVDTACMVNSVNGTSDIHQFENMIDKLTNSRGVDGVLICAATTSKSPIDLALSIVRNEGRVVLVGTARIEFSRRDLYDTEAEFSVSRSYGPGRYDSTYEEKGLDYPYEYVRWTENRNMLFFLSLLSNNKISITELISNEVEFESAPLFFEALASRTIKPIGAVIKYREDKSEEIKPFLDLTRKPVSNGGVNVGIIGVGIFAQTVILPILSKIPDVIITSVCSKTPIKVKEAGMKWNARLCTTDPKKIIESDEVNLVVISTPHNLHAELVLEALKHEKAVFVEKPLAMNKKELRQIIDAYEETKGFIMVGFNRRYSPIIERTKDYLSKCYGPKIIDYEVHVESLPANNWINDPEIGGGRILGEACHFFDLFRYLIEAKWKDVFSKYIPVRVTQGSSGEDFIVSINWEDGSASTLKYTTMG